MNVTGCELMLTLEETILHGRESWSVIVLLGCLPMDAVIKKHDLISDGLILDEDFCWAYRSSEYDGFTMNRDRHAVFAFRDPVVAGFYRLKWL